MEVHTSNGDPRAPAVTLKALEALFSGCDDFISRDLDFGLAGRLRLTACWLDGPVSGDQISENVIRPLTSRLRAEEIFSEAACFARVCAGGITRCSVRELRDPETAAEELCHGSCALLFPGLGTALCFEVRSSQTRSVSEPSLEKSLKGAKDSFTETLRVNTALVRQRLATPDLKLLNSQLGRESRTRVSLLYLNSHVDPRVLTEVQRRLDGLDPEALLATGPLEAALSDCPASPFPQLIHTERPDRFAMHLSQGRIGLLVDGLPIGLILPVDLSEFMKVTGDSSTHFLVATQLSMLRWLALITGALLPGFYVAVARFHQEMIPTRLLLSIIEAERDVPFSTALEVLCMLLAFSLLQEAGLRMPNPIGDTVSIIGALIVGQAAVEASLVSPLAIIVVAVSGICCYTLPSQDLAFAVRLVRLLLVFGAILGGLYGMGLICCLVLLHLADLDSFGTNYTAPVSDGHPLGLLRLLIHLPQRRNGKRRRSDP